MREVDQYEYVSNGTLTLHDFLAHGHSHGGGGHGHSHGGGHSHGRKTKGHGHSHNGSLNSHERKPLQGWYNDPCLF